MVTLQWASIERGRCRAVRGQKKHRRRAQARQPRTTFSSLLSTLYLPHSWFKFVFRVFRVFRGFPTSTSGDARRNRRAGALKRANHALPSPPYPLLSTCPIRGSNLFFVFFVCFVVSLLPPRATHGGIAVRARPSAPTTHYLLLPTLYSLPSTKDADNPSAES